MDDTSSDITRDGTELYYNYNAISNGGDSEIWVSTRCRFVILSGAPYSNCR